MQVQRTFKKREGVWGIVKGDKGGASQVAPLSPLTKEIKNGIAKRCFASLNMTNGIFGGVVLTALLMCDSYVMSATKVAPPFPPPLRRGQGGWVIASEHNVRAQQLTVCEARIMGILCRLIASASPRNDRILVSLFAMPNMTIATSQSQTCYNSTSKSRTYPQPDAANAQSLGMEANLRRLNYGNNERPT